MTKNSYRRFFNLLYWCCLVICIFQFNVGLHAEEKSLSIKQMLLTPGDLTQAHAPIESQCKKCHEHFEQANQTPLCLDCHKKIQLDIKDKKHFHGNLQKTSIINCKTCHSDHLGRKADIVGLDKDNFEHSATGFTLRGAHENLQCNLCHNSSHQNSKLKFTNFRIEKKACIDCHKDIHEGKLGKDCSTCHSEKGWHKTNFDHSKTDFPLKGEHKNLVCSSCHKNEQFKDTLSKCVSCHLSKDKHLGVMGDKCETCHAEVKWSKTHFNHNKDTKFNLLGKHQDLRCEACHRKNLPLKLPSKCIDCHLADDIHKKTNGEKCQDCHNSKSWKNSGFNHNKDTDFALVGIHKKISCQSCHKGGHSNKTNVAGNHCFDCHKTIDPHQGNLGKDCASCHQQMAWNKNTSFDHDFSSFPLTGAHKALLCENCHFDEKFQDVAHECQQCHIGDDAHEGTLGKKCGTCHNTVAWSSWEFDHNSQTKFILDGAHQNLSCDLCHNKNSTNPVLPSSQCNSCHQQDDIHHGDFGPDCEQCHSTDVFDDVR